MSIALLWSSEVKPVAIFRVGLYTQWVPSQLLAETVWVGQNASFLRLVWLSCLGLLGPSRQNMSTWDSTVIWQWALSSSALRTWLPPQRAPKPGEATLPVVTDWCFSASFTCMCHSRIWRHGSATLFLMALMLTPVLC